MFSYSLRSREHFYNFCDPSPFRIRSIPILYPFYTRSVRVLLPILYPFCARSRSRSRSYTCQLFLRYRCEIFILGVLGFLKMTRSFLKIPEEVRSLPKTSKVFRRRPKHKHELVPSAFHFKKSEIARKVLSFIHFTHGFRSLHGSELTYFWKLCHARWQQLTFFNQA